MQFIIENNKERKYQHFQIGKTDRESGGAWQRLLRTWKRYGEWKTQLKTTAYETQSKIATKTFNVNGNGNYNKDCYEDETSLRDYENYSTL